MTWLIRASVYGGSPDKCAHFYSGGKAEIITMFEDLSELMLASALFVGGHVVLSSPTMFGPIRAKFGAEPFQGFYSLIILTTLIWMVHAYKAAAETILWATPTFFCICRSALCF